MDVSFREEAPVMYWLIDGLVDLGLQWGKERWDHSKTHIHTLNNAEGIIARAGV